MNCERYKEKMVEALATEEGALSEELAAHLRACTECGKFYEAQINLFGAIDSGVRAMVNETVPRSLLPGVRAQVAEARMPRQSWGVYLLPVGAALGVAILLGVFFMGPKNVPVRVAVVPAAESPTQKVVESGSAEEKTASINGVRRAALENSRTVRREDLARTIGPDETSQVVVGREEARGLVMLAKNVSQHPELGQALLHPVALTEGQTPTPQALKIEDLEVLPLAEQD